MSKEQVVLSVDDLQDGEMKRVSVDETEVLLCRIKGKYYAVGAHCTHYGAPLDEGVLSGERIICPWHHACFNAKTGDLAEPPALDALPAFEVRIDGDDVLVKLPAEVDEHRAPQMAKLDSKRDHRTFVIVGAGAAGNMAAQTLREDGFLGRIVMLTHENRLPYDRPNLSKDYLAGHAEEEWMPLRSQDFYQQYKIELMYKTKVTGVDVLEKTLGFENGDAMTYDVLLLAMGGEARQLKVAGADLKNVFTLRYYDDSDKIITASKNAARVAVVGASFIGMETAFSLSQRDLPVTVIAPESVPFEKIFGNEIGELFKSAHEQNGVKFHLGASVAKFEGSSKVEAVVLQDGKRIEADLVIVGIGVRPATDFLKGAEFLNSDGSVRTDEFFKAKKDIYAVGDIARFPFWLTGEDTRIEHWRTAEQQGRIAAHNLTGHAMAFTEVPFFWTTQAGINFRYVGHAKDWEDIIFWGEVSSKKFIAFYVKKSRVVAAAGIGRDKEMAAIEGLLRLKEMPAPDELKKGEMDLISKLKKMETI